MTLLFQIFTNAKERVKLDFPYDNFGTRGVTADLLFPTCIVWEAIRMIEGKYLVLRQWGESLS